jgi:uncharacterized protein (UPF0261 family)
MTSVVLLGTLDTKGLEYDFVRERVRAAGCDVILVDAGVLDVPLTQPDIPREEVARAAGADVAALLEKRDRGLAVETMTRGATAVVRKLYQEGSLQGILGLGGSSGTSLISQAMQALPIGVPKLIVSSVASGDTRLYVGAVDITMMYSVVDIAGINRISEGILTNAAAAIAGMARAHADFKPTLNSKALVATTMFGVTTPCVTAARHWLEDRGYEVLVFHATGTGGRSMEALINGGVIAGVLDITTTELADDLLGGVMSAGPHRLEAAGSQGVPQIISLGALNVVNFGSIETVPEKFRSRWLYQANPSVTLMRTTPEECAQLGQMIARKLNAATGPVSVFIPLQGISMSATRYGHFYDPIADQALIDNLKGGLRPSIEVYELDMDINDVRFAYAMAERLDEYIRC